MTRGAEEEDGGRVFGTQHSGLIRLRRASGVGRSSFEGLRRRLRGSSQFSSQATHKTRDTRNPCTANVPLPKFLEREGKNL